MVNQVFRLERRYGLSWLLIVFFLGPRGYVLSCHENTRISDNILAMPSGIGSVGYYLVSEWLRNGLPTICQCMGRD